MEEEVAMTYGSQLRFFGNDFPAAGGEFTFRFCGNFWEMFENL